MKTYEYVKEAINKRSSAMLDNAGIVFNFESKLRMQYLERKAREK